MHLFCSGVAPLIGCSVFVPGVFSWASLATRDCACRRYLRPLGVSCWEFCVVPVRCLTLWFLRNGARSSPTRVSRFEIASLGLQRSWGAAQSSVARIACDCWGMWRAGRTAVFARRPEDGAYHTWGASGLCASGVLRCWTRPWWLVWVTSASERDIRKDSIRQGREAARDCRVSGRSRRCVVAVSYSPTTHRLQYHRRCRA